MTISNRCLICKSPTKRRLVELGWNDGMSCPELEDALGGTHKAATILKHLKEHADGVPSQRMAEVAPVGTVRERVLALQAMQLNEVERRITLAKERAAQLNAALDDMAERGVEGADTAPRHDWSEFYDLLHKDNQAAINSILKTQGLSDKREAKTNELKLGLFETMAKAGLAPKAISGAPAAPALPSGEHDDEAD